MLTPDNQRGFKSPITIKSAIDGIVARKYLLPAIQRKFVWSASKIELLFDSIMRDYPINSFMFWLVSDSKVKNEFQFYEFLTKYRQRFADSNPYIDTKGINEFFAVIDGQQRLTSLYIGLKGSYAYKMPRKWWVDDEIALPTRFLYLNLDQILPPDNDRQMVYDFRFLTLNEFKHLTNLGQNWFKVNDILNFTKLADLIRFTSSNPEKFSDFALDTLTILYQKIFEERLINYYLETNQNIDAVLDIFIRTNSGGEPLSFSNLLMSVTTANWKIHDAREEIENLIKQVFTIGRPGFIINADFILKTCLVLFNDNIKFQVKNFTADNVTTFDDNWDRISSCILSAFRLLESWGFNDSNLRAKNAVIPIIYYIYYHNLENSINVAYKHSEEKNTMRKWLCISILKGVFGSQTDSLLKNLRNILKENLSKNEFPFEEIRTFFSKKPKNLSFDIDYINTLLKTQKDDHRCFAVLSLLYSHLDFNQVLHKDHLHPISYFQKLKENPEMEEEVYNFYKDPENNNSVLNLQLLNGRVNESKNDKSLEEWVQENHVDLKNSLIPENISLAIDNFPEFVECRRKLLTNIFLKITNSVPINSSNSTSNTQLEDSIEDIYTED